MVGERVREVTRDSSFSCRDHGDKMLSSEAKQESRLVTGVEGKAVISVLSGLDASMRIHSNETAVGS